MSRLAAELSALVEDELRAFNVERLYADRQGRRPPARSSKPRGTLPMMGGPPRGRRAARGEAAEAEAQGEGGRDEPEPTTAEPAADVDALEAYVKSPEPQTTLVFVAADVDRSAAALQGASEAGHDRRVLGAEAEQGRAGRSAAGRADRRSSWCGRRSPTPGSRSIPAAARLVAERAGTDIATLRGDVERLLLYAAGKPRIDRRRRAGSRERGNRAGRLGGHQRDPARRHGRGAAAARAGARVRRGVRFMILGQLGWFVREKLPTIDARRCRRRSRRCSARTST